MTIPDDYLRLDMWEALKDIPNIEEYNCPHAWFCDCGTVTGTEQLIYFCHWCGKKSGSNECKECGHDIGLHNAPHGKDNAYICLSVFPTFCGCKEFKGF